MKVIHYCPICREPCEVHEDGKWNCPECRSVWYWTEAITGERRMHQDPLPDKEEVKTTIYFPKLVAQLKEIKETLTGLVGIVGFFGLLLLVFGTKGCF